MIQLTGYDSDEVVFINHKHIISLVQTKHMTYVSLSNGQEIEVHESASEIYFDIKELEGETP